MHDRNGKSSGLVILLLLIAALLIVFLAVKQMQSVGFEDGPGDAAQSDAVEQAQNAVNAINEHMGANGGGVNGDGSY